MVNGRGAKAGQRAVEISTAIAQPEPGAVPADDRSQRDHRHQPFGVRGRNGNIPIPSHHPQTGLPAAKDQRACTHLDHRQRDDDARIVQLGHQAAQIRFALDRPIGGQDHPRRAAEPVRQDLPQMPRQSGTCGLPVSHRKRVPFSPQADALGPPPARHVAGLFGVCCQRVKVIRRDLGSQTGWRSIVARIRHRHARRVRTAGKAPRFPAACVRSDRR